MKPPPHLRVVHGIKRRALDASEGLQARGVLTAAAASYPVLAPVLPFLLETVQRETTSAERWDFLMINAHQHAAVIRAVLAHAERPRVSIALLAELLENLDKDTGAVLVTRDVLAKRVGAPPNHVSSAMAEFVRWNVLRRFQNGRAALWVFNPNIGTRLPGAAGDAARKAAGPVLRLAGGTDAGGIVRDERQPDLI